MDHLVQLERKCAEASGVLDKLGSMSQEGEAFIKGEILFNCEELSRNLKENLSKQTRELQNMSASANSKQTRLQDLSSQLDVAKLRHAQLGTKLQLAKAKRQEQLGEEDMLADKQLAISKRLSELGDKLQAMERKTANAQTAAPSAVAEGGLESFLRQSELFKRLGLSVSKLPKGRIRVSFHLVDPADHQRQFSFLVHVQDEEYFVEDVRPALASSNLPEMVRELNSSNDFSWFARSMRRKFQDTCRV
ncbi:hypothetical protein BASA81_011108 [Batrachochytrium salamandrivorans]|nr:hypothetical protein BASA81_011108 [Batrachochytrium salamandrivorans]